MLSLSELRSRLLSPRPGKVVLFTGAGFSDGAKNTNGERVPFSRDFSKLICTRLGVTEDLPLTLAAELFNEAMQDERAILKLVKDTFTIGNVTPAHLSISSYPWRRRYTTNYDDLLEFIDPTLKSMNRDQLSFDIEKDAQVVHLNGSVKHISERSSLDEIQLTMSHYFDKDLFDTPWASTFRSDLELCDTILFVGYSMYDPDISKIIYNDPNLRKKTVIIQHDKLAVNEERWLSRFGSVFKIGNQGLQEILDSIKEEGGPNISTVEVENFSEYLVNTGTNVQPAGPDDLAALLERGVFSRDIYGSSLARKPNGYLADRSAADEIVSAVNMGARNILVHADMGNGKSVILEKAARDIAGALGKPTYFYDNVSDLLDYDVAALQTSAKEFVLIFDGFFDNQKVIETFRSQLSNAIIIASERTASYELRMLEVSEILGTKHIEVNANKLTPTDTSSIINLLNSGAYWSEYDGASSFAAKQKIVEKQCSSEMSSLLLGVIKSSVYKAEIARKIKNLEENSQNGELDLICGALILSFMGMPTQFWLLSELVGRDMFTISRSFSDDNLRHFFSITGREVSARSPILAQYVLREIFNDQYIVDLMLKMLARSSDRHKRSKTFRTINSRLIQFKNIDKLVRSSNNRHDIINRYYQRVGDIGYKDFSPPYWSQFAIAARSFNDFKPADRYFKEAQRIGLTRNDYYLYKVQNAYAQFLVESRALSEHWSDYAGAFLEASGIALSQTSIRQAGNYPYKVAGYFSDFAERKSVKLDQREKGLLSQECLKWLAHIDSLKGAKSKDRLVKQARGSVSHAFDVFSSC